jgi:hypothetical protein
MFKNIVKRKMFLYVIAIMAFFIVGYICRNNIFIFLLGIIKKILYFFSNSIPNSAFLSDIATFEGILIGVAIPISLQVVSWTVDRYKDQEIAQFFIKEPLYKIQYLLLLPNIAIVIFLRFLNISNLIFLWFIFLWLILNMVIFYKFVRLVEQYITNTDKLLLRKLKRHVEIILKK